jgi:hypothetical protein
MQHTAAAQYRSIAAQIRAMAQETITPEIRVELMTLAEQFERLADLAEAKAAAAFLA